MKTHVDFSYFENKIFNFKENALKYGEKFKVFHKELHKHYLHIPQYVVFYENLVKHRDQELKKILLFLGIKMSKEVEECMDKYAADEFKRPKRPQNELDLIYGQFSKEEMDGFQKNYNYVVKLFEKNIQT